MSCRLLTILRRVRERIARAAEAAGRSGRRDHAGRRDEVRRRRAKRPSSSTAGCTDLGESRPQELWSKAGELASASGRARPASAGTSSATCSATKSAARCRWSSLIHSVDSERLLAAIDAEWQICARRATEPRPPIRVLLEVNTSGEAAKHGLAPDDVEPLLAAASRFPRVAICGLMTMAALEGGLDVAARNFATLRELRRPRSQLAHELSMGMSGDFEVAIREGATIVRIGSALWE